MKAYIEPLETFVDPLTILVEITSDRYFKESFQGVKVLQYSGKAPKVEDLIEYVPKTAHDRAVNAWELIAKHAEDLDKEVTRLKKALEFYADEGNYCRELNTYDSFSASEIETDDGKRAREALAEIKEVVGKI